MRAALWDLKLRKIQKLKGKVLWQVGNESHGPDICHLCKDMKYEAHCFCLNVFFVQTNSSYVCLCKLSKKMKKLTKHKIYFMFILTNIVSLLNKITYVTKSFILLFSHLNFFLRMRTNCDITFVLHVCFLCNPSSNFLTFFWGGGGWALRSAW